MKDKTIRLLLVEDDKVDQMAFERFVEKENLPYDYTIVHSVAEGKAILQTECFDVIISDYWLGDGTSFELFELFNDIPVIVTTGTGNEEVAVEAMKLGACDYLIKDPDGNYLKTLSTTVEFALKRKNNEKELQNYHERLEVMVEERTSELRKSLNHERNLTEIIEKSLNEIFIFDAENYAFLFVNEEARKNLGYSLAELLEMTPVDIKPEIDAASFEKIVIPLRIGQKDKIIFDTVHERKDGSIYSVEVHLQKTEYRSIPVFVALIIDISQRKEMEKRYEELVEGTNDLITQVDKEGNFIYCNHMAREIFGYDPEQLIGRNAFTFIYPDDREMTKKWFENCLNRNLSHGSIENRQINQDTGVAHDMQWSTNFNYDEQGDLVSIISISRDITEKKQLEAKLLQSQKMEAIGTLAGGIAHDFNNILSAIIGYAEFIQLEATPGSRIEKDIHEVLKAGGRAADLVKQILTLSRQTKTKKQPIRPHLIVKEAMKLLHATLPTSITIEEDIDSDCGTILTDATNLHQITINLCTNGLHAMADEKGTLSVSLQRRNVSAEEISGEVSQTPGPFVVFTVSDTGCGMDDATRNRIFEPYFTTKKIGKGTGLGLAVIQGIVYDAQGFIRVKSSPGKGSSFAVYLPVFQEENTTGQKQDQKVPYQGGNEHILIVDDETLLVRVTQRQLEHMGYKVTATTDSIDALKKIKTRSDKFDLLISDQTMPGLTGMELAREVKKIRADLPVILCTGHSATVSREQALKSGISEFIFKPIIGDDLFKVVRSVLDKKNETSRT